MSDLPLYELVIERHIAAPPAHVYKVWTERLPEWWAPKPWITQVTALELWPGGRSEMTMAGPDGEVSPVAGVILEVVPEQRIVFTDAFRAGWIPHPPFMTGLFEFAPDGAGTAYRAAARHWDEETMRKHGDMGFAEGWGMVADQLKVLCEA